MRRGIDILASTVLLILFIPVFSVIGLLIRLKLGEPVIFRHDRPGLGGRKFTLLKFRSMQDIYNSEGKILPDEERLTKFGAFLRSTSLDELPELINVLRGDMSLVGPRPLLMRYLERYSPEQARRHEVRPGITGWAQVSGRNAISWEEKFRLDVWYVDNRSIILDLKILILTVLITIKREDITQEGCATMEEFMGNESTTFYDPK